MIRSSDDRHQRLEFLPSRQVPKARATAALAALLFYSALTAEAEIARLKFQLARYRRAEFGRSSEKLTRETEQLELELETLETDQAERLATASRPMSKRVVSTWWSALNRTDSPGVLSRASLKLRNVSAPARSL